MNKKNIIILGIAGLLLVFGVWFMLRELLAPEYTLAAERPDFAEDPMQLSQPPYEEIRMQFGKEKYTLQPQAEYSISAYLVSKRSYHRGYMHRLSPWDYGLIWGEVPNQLEHLKFNQVVRFLLFKYKFGAPIDVEYIQRHLANTHLIPANQNIRRALRYARKGNTVRLEGYLVNVTGTKKGRATGTWQSSMSREDKGNGACEVMYVKTLQIENRLYK
ncbi:MAG: hypothetical protein WCY84_01440 [Candidatus Cloacimonadaceae bacterium]